ncbi:putative molybdopterin/thiamine biosynthesis protein [Candidatus Vecturithrix granuli]|uniref:Putative molybdopterin/thiamine biosynthesis protein n=1 Tax=Vecturithrix granuli TaxID=1499967 RepID=A0A081BZR6_VECG1|nr:putative molybdopterin/thiamine biosynthesis protein [Candidatus Vecturithrix granuli]
MKQIRITLNEHPISIRSGTKLFELASLKKPDADILVLNGFPARQDCQLCEGDVVMLIKRGEIPSQEDLEALMAARHTPGVHEVLKQSCVGIAGLGGLGSNIAVSLARVGIGKLILVDFDVVEPSNLNRQQYFIDQIGKLKTEALRETLQKINPFLEYEAIPARITEDNVAELFGGVHVVVEAFDAAETKAMFIEAVHVQLPETPIVCGSGIAGYGDNASLHTRQIGYLYICGDEKTEARPGQGLMAPRVGIVANMQANQVMEILLTQKRS